MLTRYATMWHEEAIDPITTNRTYTETNIPITHYDITDATHEELVETVETLSGYN